MKKNELIENLRKILQPVVSRKTASIALGGLISSRTLANLDSMGKGPGGKMKFGSRTVGYEKMAFIAWVEERIHEVADAS